MPGRNSHGRKQTLRGLALALTLVCLGGQLSSALHVIVVRHVTCAEHGELIHAEAVAAPARRASAGATFEASAASVSHRHEHCLVATHRAAGVTVARAEAAPAVFAPDRVALATPVAGSHPHPVPLLLEAPKSSPPA